ncbi:MAG: TetR/AcrR family transcriptional regulator [Porticoccaceae bacterium]
MPSNTAKEKKSAPQAGTPTPKRRRRKSWDESTQESKQKIISAAFLCFGKIGYQKTTLTDIANVAGCSRELPRYHFKSKEGLVTALLDKILTDWKTIFEMPKQQGVTGTAAIHMMLDIYLGMSKNDPTVYNGRLALIFQLADPSMEPVKDQVVTMQRALRNGFRDFIKQSVIQGDSPRNTDIDAMAAIIFATFRGLAYQLMTDPEATDMQRIGKQLKVVINKIMA